MSTKPVPPFAGKVYISGKIDKVHVGMKQVYLSDTVVINAEGKQTVKSNSPVTLYDTAGPYSDPRYIPYMGKGIPRIREEWYGRRKDIVIREGKASPGPKKKGTFPVTKPVFHARNERQISQMSYAKKRVITPEMEYVAIRENQQVEALGLKSYITPDYVRREVASGRAVIPANINHPEAEPMIIGQRFLVKINMDLIPSGEGYERDTMRMIEYCRLGTDVLTDLSDTVESKRNRDWLLRNCPVPICTRPLYEALAQAGGEPADITWPIFRDTLVKQMEQGVDIIVVHAAMHRKHLDLIDNRLTHLASLSGSILHRWMKAHKQENFLYTYFDEICDLLRMYDAVLSIGSGLRPGSVYDANDRAQFAELYEMRDLTERAWKQYVQTMTEGPGHVPMNKIEANVKEQLYVCKGAPFHTPGMKTTDIGGKYDYIASAIGSAQVAWYGASLIGGSIWQEYRERPTGEEVQASILAHKIAAHTADLAKGHPGAQVRDNALGKARKEGRMEDIYALSFGW